MIQRIKAYYKGSYLEMGVEWHMTEIKKVWKTLILICKNYNILGKIFVSPFLFLAFGFFIFTNLCIFSVGLVITIIGLFFIGIGKLFELAFIKGEEKDKKIIGHRPPEVN